MAPTPAHAACAAFHATRMAASALTAKPFSRVAPQAATSHSSSQSFSWDDVGAAAFSLGSGVASEAESDIASGAGSSSSSSRSHPPSLKGLSAKASAADASTGSGEGRPAAARAPDYLGELKDQRAERQVPFTLARQMQWGGLRQSVGRLRIGVRVVARKATRLQKGRGQGSRADTRMMCVHSVCKTSTGGLLCSTSTRRR
jgi:hypothetical protein